ncbi:MAG: tetratricopeptide repeat protein [Chloroflexaceae bacterium]|nr:tetratricopeptide repeat protein [Chloroflexaceae bacterium]
MMMVDSIPHNPYIAGRKLNQPHSFFGREDIFHLVETELALPDQNAVVLFGQRRIGKTSILLQLKSRLATDRFLPVYFDLVDHTRKPLGQVLFKLASTMAAEVGKAPGSPDAFDDEGRFFRQKFLPAFYKALGDERRPVLLFDEFDVLDTSTEERLPYPAGPRVFFPYLRELLEGEPRLGFVFVIGRKADDLSIEMKALFKAAAYKRVSVLDEADARALVLTAEREGTLTFTEDAIAHILALTARHPYFIQLLCRTIWSNAYDDHSEGVPTIDLPEVEAAIPGALEAGQNVFEWIWDGLPPAERVIFAAIASAADEQRMLTRDEIQNILQYHGIRILIGELDQAPNVLVEWEMLRCEHGSYGFLVELLRRWIASRKPLPRVKEEQHRIVPLADTLYQAGHGFYQQGDMDNARSLLGQALNLNPNHLKARLLRAKILRERNRLDEAIRELEEAYRYDEDAARYPLVQTLLVQGEAMEQAGDEEGACLIYERVLHLAPQETTAQQRRTRIWVQRGNRALEDDDLDTAMVAYQEAGVSERVTFVGMLQQKRALEAELARARSHEAQQEWDSAIEVYDRLACQHPDDPSLPEALMQVIASKRRAELKEKEDEARQYARREQWQEAIPLYEWLVAQGPGETSWQDALEQMREEHELSQRYAQGFGALKQKRWSQALQALTAVIAIRPDYQDAADLLALAVQEQRREQRAGARSSRSRVVRWLLAMLRIVVLVLLLAGAMYVLGMVGMTHLAPAGALVVPRGYHLGYHRMVTGSSISTLGPSLGEPGCGEPRTGSRAKSSGR